jgi:hypothetical protein
MRHIERAAQLEDRARDCHAKEDRRKQNAKKRKDREEREAAARRQLGISLSTQLAGYSNTQKTLKRKMESWIGLGGKSKRPRASPDASDCPRSPASEAPSSNEDPPGNGGSHSQTSIGSLSSVPTASPTRKKEEETDEFEADCLDDDTLLSIVVQFSQRRPSAQTLPRTPSRTPQKASTPIHIHLPLLIETVRSDILNAAQVER